MTGPETGFSRLLEVLNRLNIPYLVGGSLASSIFGITRATMDMDLVADVRSEHITALVAELGSEFYADPAMIEQALRAGRPFNLIHYPSSYKFDVFPLLAEPFYQFKFERRKMVESSLGGQEPLNFFVTTAEDIVLSKLAWYREGGEVSQQQWNDIRGVLRVQGDRLDRDYLRNWSRHLRVEDLLDRALAEL